LRISHVAITAAKLAVTALCFWYLASNIDVRALAGDAKTLHLPSVCLAVIVLMAQIPLVGLRWRFIVDALGGSGNKLPAAPAIACTAVSSFFSQVIPNVAADALRVWMLTQLGRGWRLATASVVIDRAIGIVALIAVGLVMLQLPSPLAALGGHRAAVTELFVALLVIGLASLLLARGLGTVLEFWRYTAWLGRFAKAAHSVLLARRTGFAVAGIAVVVQLQTILAVWLLSQAADLALSMLDAGVLFVVMVAVALIPISIAGWGVRELTVVSLLTGYGISLERALFFSVSFGLALLIAALPGALVWAMYWPLRRREYALASKT
jgi:uncharacterized membrane protein YbhN (UPF0104 family)